MIHILIRFIVKYNSLIVWDWIGLVFILVVNGFIYNFLKSSAKPTYSETGKLEDPGTDLRSKGLIEYCWDILFIIWFIEISSVLSRWFWSIFLIVPVFALYKGISLLSSGPSFGEEMYDESQKKKKEKVKFKTVRR